MILPEGICQPKLDKGHHLIPAAEAIQDHSSAGIAILEYLLKGDVLDARETQYCNFQTGELRRLDFVNLTFIEESPFC